MGDSALEGFGGVPPIRPLETLHNALSLKQLDTFLEQMTSVPLFRTPASSPPKHPSTPLPSQLRKRPSPTNSAGWSGPPSLLSSCGPASAGSSSGPSSPNCLSDFGERAPSDMSASQISTDGYGALGLPSLSHMFPELDQDLGSVGAELDADLYPAFGSQSHGLMSSVTGLGLMGLRSTSGDITPVSTSSEWEFNTNEATIGSTTDHDITGAEEEEEEETTISAETSFTAGDQDMTMSSSSINNDPFRTTFKPVALPPGKLIKNDLSELSSGEQKNLLWNYEKDLCDNMATKHLSPICVKPTPLRKVNNDASSTEMFSSPQDSGGDPNVSPSDALATKECFIEPLKIARQSKSFHGKTQSSNVTLGFRRASEGLPISTSGTLVDVDKSSQATKTEISPSNVMKSSQENIGSGASPKKTTSRFTTTPVSEAAFMLKPSSSSTDGFSSPKVTVSTDTVVTQGFKINTDTKL